MDVLKQLETKLRALVDERNRLRQELEGQAKAREEAMGAQDGLRQRLEAAEAERDALRAERESTRKEVEKILKLLEGAG